MLWFSASGVSANGDRAGKQKLERLKKYFSIPRPLRGVVSFMTALLLFMLVKIFAFEIIKVNGHDMEQTYKPGDTFLISKIANNYKTNDIIYFEFPETDSNATKTWCLQRLIGLPGDTLQIVDKRIYLNNYPLMDTTTIKNNYYVTSRRAIDSSFISRYGLHEGGSISVDFDYSYSLSKETAEKLAGDSTVLKMQLKLEQPGTFDETVFPYSTVYNWNLDHFGKLYIPRRNDTLSLNAKSIILYSKLITIYEKNALEIKGDTILVNNKPAKTYTVKRNYYFVLGDNRDNANDSRVFGLLPENYIRGKVVALLKKEK